MTAANSTAPAGAPAAGSAAAAAAAATAPAAPGSPSAADVRTFRENHRLMRQELFAFARDLHSFTDAIARPLCQAHDLTQRQLHVLVELSLEPDQRPSHVSDRMGMLRTNFTSLAHKLEKRGLICRAQSIDDRRAYTLHLTDQGLDLLQKLNDEMDAAHQALFDNVPDNTVADLLRGWNAVRQLVAAANGR